MDSTDRLEKLRRSIDSVYHGRAETVELCMTALLARGHLLLEDVPGVGKTTLASVLARSINCLFRRIQFTSDLLPSDILGVTIFNRDKNAFEFKEGPLFANVVLADEINRTTPKTQSALLEAMSTAIVSMDGKSWPLPIPFIVLASQNPLVFVGSCPLPKSQMDRFILRMHLGYPDAGDEIRVLKEQGLGLAEARVEPVLTADHVVALQEAVVAVKIEESLLDYIVRIGRASRDSPRFELGASTRGLLALRRCAQATAYLAGREYVVPDDIQKVAVPVLAHRVQVARTFERTGLVHHEDEDAVRELIDSVDVPL